MRATRNRIHRSRASRRRRTHHTTSHFARRRTRHGGRSLGGSSRFGGLHSITRSARARTNDLRFRWASITSLSYYRVETDPHILTSKYAISAHMDNARSGFSRYDTVNCFMHRRYSRIHHNYQTPVAPVTESIAVDSTEFDVTYEALRSTFPPDSPNFAFVPLSDFGDVTATPGVVNKILGLLLRNHPSRMAYMTEYIDPQRAVDSLLESLSDVRGVMVDLGRTPEEMGGSWVPDWLFCYMCCMGNEETRKDQWAQENYDDVVNELVCIFNRSPMFAAFGISTTYIDIGNSFTGIVFEVLPYAVTLNTAAEIDPDHLEQTINAHFYCSSESGETSPTTFCSAAEVKALIIMAFVARGFDISDEIYDNAMQAVTGPGSEIYVQPKKEGAEAADAPFLVEIPSYCEPGYLLSVQAPADGAMMTFLLPQLCTGGMYLTITPPSVAQTDPTIIASTSKSTSNSYSYSNSNSYTDNNTDGNTEGIQLTQGEGMLTGKALYGVPVPGFNLSVPSVHLPKTSTTTTTTTTSGAIKIPVAMAMDERGTPPPLQSNVVVPLEVVMTKPTVPAMSYERSKE
jgi:hypothetical protein